MTKQYDGIKEQENYDKKLIKVFLNSLSINDIAEICENAGLNKNRVYEAIVRSRDR